MTIYKNYIEGEWVSSAEIFNNINPSDTADIIGEYAQADKAQTEQAIESAARAFEGWSRSGIQQRSEILACRRTDPRWRRLRRRYRAVVGI